MASTLLNTYLDWTGLAQVYQYQSERKHIRIGEITYQTQYGLSSLISRTLTHTPKEDIGRLKISRITHEMGFSQRGFPGSMWQYSIYRGNPAQYRPNAPSRAIHKSILKPF